jgi:hypothetical protein
MAKRVFIGTRDLMFRSKLVGVVTACGDAVTRDVASCNLAVIETEITSATEQIRELVARGVAVLAHGSHVRADLLRAAREAGATAVPNSAVEAQLRELLEGPR